MTLDREQRGPQGLALEELTAPEVVERLGLAPHPEGGFFREVYRSPLNLQSEAGRRPLSTSILYLVAAESPSRFHRLRSDEIWFFHAGAPVEIVLLQSGKVVQQVLGPDIPQLVVPAECWMAARVLSEDQADWGVGWAPERRWTPDRRSAPQPHWALVGCVVSPGFVPEDFEEGDQGALLREYPQARMEILALS